jgi:hypothetical protein
MAKIWTEYLPDSNICHFPHADHVTCGLVFMVRNMNAYYYKTLLFKYLIVSG